MIDYVVWLDSDKAKIFALKVGGVEKSHLEKRGTDHHTQNKHDQHGNNEQEHFFRDLALKLKDVEQLLLMGPGMAKTHFKTHLETHHTNGLGKRILATENCDHPTDNEILADARRFFKKYDFFNDPIR